MRPFKAKRKTSERSEHRLYKAIGRAMQKQADRARETQRRMKEEARA